MHYHHCKNSLTSKELVTTCSCHFVYRLLDMVIGYHFFPEHKIHEITHL